MSLNKVIKEKFKNKEELSKERLEASTFILILVTFIFFTNFFLVGANFYYNILIIILPFSYTIFIFTLYLYTCTFVRDYYGKRIGSITHILFCKIVFVVFVFLLLPFVFRNGLLGIFNDIKDFIFML